MSQAATTGHEAQETERLIAPLVRLLTQYLDGPGTVGPSLGLNEQDLETVYAVGHQFYRSGRYDQALKLFSLAAIGDHMEKRYVVATGAALQMLQRHQEALGFYGMAGYLDPTDPAPSFHAGECLMAMGSVDEAIDAFKTALDDCQPGRDDELRKRAQGLLKLLARSQAKEGSATP